MLHGEADMGGATGDVDIVAEAPAATLLRRVGSQLSSPAVMLWPYEPGGASNLFLTSPSMDEGAQIDILFDPRGEGRLGFRSHDLLTQTTEGVAFPVLNRTSELLYLIRKRVAKAEPGRLALLVEEAASSPDLDGILDQIATATARTSIKAALSGNLPKQPIRTPISPNRLLRRLSNPVGAWIHCAGDSGRELAEEVDRLAARIFPHHGSGVTPELPVRTLWWTRHVQVVRLRAGIYFSWGRAGGLPRPDLILDANGRPEDVVAWLSARVMAGIQG